MRILHLTPHPDAQNGISEYSTQFGRALEQQVGLSVERVFFAEGTFAPADIARRLHAMRPGAFDVVHAELGVGTNSVFYGLSALSKDFGHRMVVTLHDAPQFVFSPTVHRFGYRVDGVLNKAVRKLVFDAAFNAFALPRIARRVARYVVLNRGAVRLLQRRVRGADVRYAPLLAYGAAEAGRIGPPTRIVCYGFVARAKGIDVAIRALRILRDRGTPAHLTVIGGVLDRGWQYSLHSLATDLGVQDAISWSGYLRPDELRAALCDAGVVVLPYRETGAMGGSAAVVQMMEHGLPVILSRTARFAGEFTDGTDALMFREGDARDLAGKLVDFIGDPALRDRLTMGARQRVKETHAPANVAKTFRSIYDELLRPTNV